MDMGFLSNMCQKFNKEEIQKLITRKLHVHKAYEKKNESLVVLTHLKSYLITFQLMEDPRPQSPRCRESGSGWDEKQK